MGFTWTKGAETTAEAQKRIGSMVNNTKIICYYECALSISEIAEKTNMSVEHVKNRVNYLKEENKIK